jgi:hypothetical protein
VPNLFSRKNFRFLLLAAFMMPFISSAAEKSSPAPRPAETCGVFQVTGYLKKSGSNYMIVLAPGTRSETKIILTSQAMGDAKHPVLLPAEESFVTAKVQMNSPVQHYRGSAQKISEINLAVPNEMRADRGTSLQVVDPKPCIIQSM